MTVMLVTYDLNQETVRPGLLDDIKTKFERWACLSESSYAIRTQMTPSAVYQELSHHLDGNDSLYVITLTEPYSGQGPEDVNQWLADYL